jgi:hypothetical protein
MARLLNEENRQVVAHPQSEVCVIICTSVPRKEMDYAYWNYLFVA